MDLDHKWNIELAFQKADRLNRKGGGVELYVKYMDTYLEIQESVYKSTAKCFWAKIQKNDHSGQAEVKDVVFIKQFAELSKWQTVMGDSTILTSAGSLTWPSVGGPINYGQ